MMFDDDNPEIKVLNSGTLIVYKSDISFLESGEEKKTFERKICNKLLRDFLNDQSIEIQHRSSGQPFISESSFHISVSHSGNWFALLVNENQTVGVDIQTHTSKLSLGLDYFVNEKEKALFNEIFSDNQLYAIWCAKESIYKKLEGAINDLKNDVSVLEIRKDIILAEFDGRKFVFDLIQDNEKTIVAG